MRVATEPDEPLPSTGLGYRANVSDDALVGNAITAVPETRDTRIGEEEEFLILASDGLWEVVSPQQAVTFVRRRLFRAFYEGLTREPQEGGTEGNAKGKEVPPSREKWADVQEVAEELVDHAHRTR